VIKEISDWIGRKGRIKWKEGKAIYRDPLPMEEIKGLGEKTDIRRILGWDLEKIKYKLNFYRRLFLA
jgi:hypothetical protein